MSQVKKQKNASKYVSILWLLCMLLLIAIAYALISNHLSKQVIALARQEDSLRIRIMELEKEEKNLRDKVDLSKSDSFIENEARTRYGYLKPGEIRFVITNPEALYGGETPVISVYESNDPPVQAGENGL